MSYISLYFFLKHSVAWWFALRGQEQSSKKGSKVSPNRLIHADSMPLRVPNHQVKSLDDDGWWMMDVGRQHMPFFSVTVRISLILAKLKKAIFIRKTTLKTGLLYTSSCWPQHFPEEKPNEMHLSSNRSLCFSFLTAVLAGPCRGKFFFFPGWDLISSCCVWCQEVLRLVALGKYNCRTERQHPKICLQETGFWPGNWRFLQGGESSHADPCRFKGWKIPDFSVGHTLTYSWSTFQQSPCDRLPV